MINGSSDDWKSERGIDGIVKSQSFQGDVTLIMVHANNAVEILASLGKECRIGGQGTGYVDAIGPSDFQSRLYNLLLLSVTEETVFTSVRIETATDQSRFLSTNAPHGLLAKFNNLKDTLLREQRWNFSVTDVRGHECATNLI